MMYMMMYMVRDLNIGFINQFPVKIYTKNKLIKMLLPKTIFYTLTCSVDAYQN